MTSMSMRAMMRGTTVVDQSQGGAGGVKVVSGCEYQCFTVDVSCSLDSKHRSARACATRRRQNDSTKSRRKRIRWFLRSGDRDSNSIASTTTTTSHSQSLTSGSLSEAPTQRFVLDITRLILDHPPPHYY